MTHNHMNDNVDDFINNIMTGTNKRLMTEDEVNNGKQLTRAEFIKRARSFVRDESIAIPTDKQNDAIKLLAIQNRRRLPTTALKGLTDKNSNLLDPSPRTKKRHTRANAKGVRTS